MRVLRSVTDLETIELVRVNEARTDLPFQIRYSKSESLSSLLFDEQFELINDLRKNCALSAALASARG